ncbi:MAG: FtsX-like permease family protein [Bacilli bacterium]
MKLLIKNTFFKIKKSFGRFLSIFFIIAIGISVFMGLRESTTGMLYTADNYYDEHKLMDFKVVSNYGLTQGDITSLTALDVSSKIVPLYSVDTLVKGKAVRVHSYSNLVNDVTLESGRLPRKKGECLAQTGNFKLNETIKFNNEYLNVDSCSVVGTISSVLYITLEKGISKIGDGKLHSYIFMPIDSFNMDYYTEAYIIGKDTTKANSYYSDYEEKIKHIKEKIEQIKPLRETIRYEEILSKANEKINEVQKEYNDKISSAYKELDNSNKELTKAQNKLNSQKSSNEKLFATKFNEINNGLTLVNNNINNILSSSLTGLTSIDELVVSLSNNVSTMKSTLSNLVSGSTEYNDLYTQIKTCEATIKACNDLISNRSNLVSGKETLNKEYSKFKNTISTNQEKLDKGYIEYNNGIKKVKEEEITLNNKIDEERLKLKDIEKPVWYLLDRKSNTGYANYKEDILKVDAIASILPIFFILIAVLVCLNTLTRLIEEERAEIGILKCNGFNNFRIMLPYIIYVLLASFLGVTVGLTIGYHIIPKIIYGVFLSRYFVPKLITVVNPIPISLITTVTFSIMTILVVVILYICLREKAASLLRPKAPPSGKKVFLERISFIWKRLNFTWKVTIRNIFRYKKRVFMTILGVAGCTALLLTGFGLNDSINNISEHQFNNIIKYDEVIVLSKNTDKLSASQEKLFKDNNITKTSLVYQEAFTYSFNSKSDDVYLVVPKTDIKNHVYLKSIISKKEVSIPKRGAIITKQLADNLDIKKGSNLSIRDSNNNLYIIYVEDIVENYVSHYIYMSSDYYNQVFNKDIKYNSVFASASGKIDEKVKLSDYDIMTINYTKDILSSFDGFVKGLNKIIYFIIIAASLLAFTVLYNLTIINISERQREIATLKVLGFSDREISVYVYRETLILTIFGIALGLILGIFLHRFILHTATTNNILFIVIIRWYSYIFAVIITIIFSFIVQLIINRTLKKIKMVESLKSVE